MDVLVKICGITSREDAAAALDAGAGALGFNFYRRSPRYIPPEAAAAITAALPPDVCSVGLFADEADPRAVLAVAVAAGVGYLQLHGGEGPTFCRGLGDFPFIKAFATRPGFDMGVLADYPAQAFLIDAFDSRRVGGTGRLCDWAMARAAKRYGRVFLAGGLDEHNVGEAVRQVRPYAVDVCSGVESAPGRKDPGRMRRFVQAARRETKG